jgi:hypothetical protein
MFVVDYLKPTREIHYDITAPMRSILIDWIIEVGDEFSFTQETIFLCSRYAL